METHTPISALTNVDLDERLLRLGAQERKLVASFIETLIEFGRRRAYLELGFDSLFSFCTQRLRLSADETYFRLYAADQCRRFPAILKSIEQGALTLTAVRILGPRLTQENHVELLRRASFLPKMKLRELLAELHPAPPVPTKIRALPHARTEQSAPAPNTILDAPSVADMDLLTSRPRSLAEAPPGRKTALSPLSPEHYRMTLTISSESFEQLQEVQDLVRAEIPNGDPARIFERALVFWLEHLRRTRRAEVGRPRMVSSPKPSHGVKPTRRVPSAIRRKIWRRDGGRCAFVGSTGLRCPAKARLQIHHVVPYAKGGAATLENLELRCRAHNAYEAEMEFGARARRGRSG